MIIGALILLVGIVLGLVTGYAVSLPIRAVLHKEHGAINSEPTCGCGHGLSMHDPKTNECHHKTLVAAKYLAEYSSSWRQCDCRQYTGPEKLPEYYVPEIS